MNACCDSSSQWMQHGKASSISSVAHISMRTTSWNGLWALVLSALMLSSLMNRPSELTENGDFEVGRQGGVEADCSGLTFEDIFNYTHADFDIVFNDDWETAEVRGVAWVNGTLADDVRSDFDDLFEPLGSDNGYLSTDEYAAVRSVAANIVPLPSGASASAYTSVCPIPGAQGCQVRPPSIVRFTPATL